MEDALLDLMYDIPSDKTINKVIITKDAIEKKSSPIIHRVLESDSDDCVQAFDTGSASESC